MSAARSPALQKRPVDERTTNLPVPGESREQGGRIEGQVLDARGRPVPNADIRVLRRGTDLLRQISGSIDGLFVLAGLPLETLEIRVRAHPHRPDARSVQFRTHGERQRLLFSLSEGKGISGRVLGPDGEPVAGASVGSSDSDSGFVTTDEDGRFTLGGLSTDPVNLFATASGFATARSNGIPLDTHELDLVLESGARVRGPLSLPPLAESSTVSLCRFEPEFRRELCLARRVYRPPVSEYDLDQLPSGNFELVAEVAGEPELRIAVELQAGSTLVGPPLTW